MKTSLIVRVAALVSAYSITLTLFHSVVSLGDRSQGRVASATITAAA